jgi:hypothetical protein
LDFSTAVRSLKGDAIAHNLVERIFAMALAAIFWKL